MTDTVSWRGEARVRSFLAGTLPANLAALAAMALVLARWGADPSLVAITAALAIRAGADWWALRSIGRRPLRVVVIAVAAVTWTVALAVTVAVPDLLVVTVLGVLFPLALALACAPDGVVGPVLAGTVAVVAALAVAGVTQDGLGAGSASLPTGLYPAIIIGFAPLACGWLAYGLWHDRSLLAEAVVAEQATAAALQESRGRLVTAADEARRSVQRDLHDGAQQRLVAAAAAARATARWLVTDPDRAASALEQLSDDLVAALGELRDLAQGVYPAVLSDHGLLAALSAVARRGPTPVDVVAAPSLGSAAPRWPALTEAALYFAALETVQNAAKHAGPHASVTIEVGRGPGEAWVSVTDNGPGPSACSLAELLADHPTGGLQGIVDRLQAAGGTLELAPARPDRPGFSVVARLPLGDT